MTIFFHLFNIILNTNKFIFINDKYKFVYDKYICKRYILGREILILKIPFTPFNNSGYHRRTA